MLCTFDKEIVLNVLGDVFERFLVGPDQLGYCHLDDCLVWQDAAFESFDVGDGPHDVIVIGVACHHVQLLGADPAQGIIDEDTHYGPVIQR